MRDSQNFRIFVGVKFILRPGFLEIPSKYNWLLAFIVVVVAGCGTSPQAETELLNDSVVVALPPSIEYGLLVDSFEVTVAKVKRNENLSDILLHENISYQNIHEVAKLSEDVFNVKKMRRGQPYKLFSSRDTGAALQCMVYEISRADYVVFDFRDSISVYRGQKPIRTEIKQASGVIEHSLYETMLENDISILVAL